MNKVVEFNKKRETVDYEKIRDKYKKDFKDFLLRRAEAEEIVFLDTRKEM